MYVVRVVPLIVLVVFTGGRVCLGRQSVLREQSTNSTKHDRRVKQKKEHEQKKRKVEKVRVILWRLS